MTYNNNSKVIDNDLKNIDSDIKKIYDDTYYKYLDPRYVEDSRNISRIKNKIESSSIRTLTTRQIRYICDNG